MLGSRLGKFAFFSWITLAYILAVAAFGAFVRASGSGAGCGQHWPLCNGVVLPKTPAFSTIVEFSHRITSGLSLVFVGVLTYWAFKRFPRGHAARQGAVFAVAFLILEAAIGAGLVLLKLVAYDTSAMRAVWISAHLINTFLLLAALAYIAWFATVGRSARLALAAWTARSAGVFLGLVLFTTVGIAGAIVALGDTLFPSTSLAAGLAEDLAPAAHFLIRLRAIHPAMAAVTAVYLIGLTYFLKARDTRDVTQRLAFALNAAIAVQIGLGVLNLVLLAPVWMQLIHLVAADVAWVTLVCLALETVSFRPAA